MEDRKTAYLNALNLDTSVLGKASNTLNTLKGLFPDLKEEITKSRSLILKLKELLGENGWKIYMPKPKPEVIDNTPKVKTPTMKEIKAKELKEITEKRDRDNMDKEDKKFMTNQILKAEVKYPDKSKAEIKNLVSADILGESIEIMEKLKDIDPNLVKGISEIITKLNKEVVN